MKFDLSEICISPTTSIREAMAAIERSEAKVALVTDAENRLDDIITDGDVRRAILAGENLDSTVNVLVHRKVNYTNPEPITAPVSTQRAKLLKLMQAHGIRQVPLLDEDRRVTGLATLSELMPEYDLPLRAVVLAGGFGERLRPLTENLPKPMLPVGNRPLLEVIVDKLREAGIRRVHLATHYKEEIISRHFGDGQDFGIEIEYVEESNPLGTAGPLSLLKDSEEPLLVINGDILTRVDFQAMLDFHREQGAEMTVAVKEHQIQLPYGVVETDGVAITNITEKPMLRHFISAGIYLLNPGACRSIPAKQHYDMPDLIKQLIANGKTVVSFPIHEYWLDIGQHADYEQAQEDLVKWDTKSARNSEEKLEGKSEEKAAG